MKKKLIVRIFTNKYILTALAFVIWTAYFDQNDWITLQRRKKQLNGIKDNIAYLNTEINRMNFEKNELLTNPVILERYAREMYRMKREGEDVYVIDKK